MVKMAQRGWRHPLWAVMIGKMLMEKSIPVTDMQRIRRTAVNNFTQIDSRELSAVSTD